LATPEFNQERPAFQNVRKSGTSTNSCGEPKT
jgi:hypothetical protein